MHVLITGANGHIGSHVARTAVARGWTTSAFVRKESDRRSLEGVEVDFREGDLLDRASLRRAMEGVEAVLHAGAVHRNYAADAEQIVAPAVKGTDNVLWAMKEAGVKKLIHTSTGGAVGFSPDPASPYDETHFFESPRMPYIRGKVESERAVLSAHERGDVEAVVLNPSGVFGPGDYRITPATRAIVGVLTGDPVFLHLCVTDVGDVAEAHARALERGRPGERYLVTGDNVAPEELAAVFRDLAGIKPPSFRPPTFLMRFLAGRMEKKAAREDSDAPVTRAAIADLDGGHLVYDSSKSRRELEMSYRPAREVLTDTFRWLLHREALPEKVAKKVRGALGERAAPDAGWR